MAIDLASHSASGLNRSTWTIPAFGQDVVAVVGHPSLDQVVLFGHPMGGSVIVEAARRLPKQLKGLVCVDTFKSIQEEIPTKEQIHNLLAPVRAGLAEPMRHSACTKMFVSASDVAFVENTVAEMAAVPPSVGTGVAEAILNGAANLRQGLTEIDVPIIAINSDFRPGDIAAAQRHGIAVGLMSGVDHFVIMEYPGTFSHLLEEAVRSFLLA